MVLEYDGTENSKKVIMGVYHENKVQLQSLQRAHLEYMSSLRWSTNNSDTLREGDDWFNDVVCSFRKINEEVREIISIVRILRTVLYEVAKYGTINYYMKYIHLEKNSVIKSSLIWNTWAPPECIDHYRYWLPFEEFHTISPGSVTPPLRISSFFHHRKIDIR